jgi:hypothetical protein
MAHRDPSIRHHDDEIPQAQFEARVPAHAQNDDLSVEVPSLKQIFDRNKPLHPFIIARHPRVCTRALPLVRLVRGLVYTFASVTVTVFFFVFYKRQS